MQGSANAELFEGLLMLQHRGQDSAGMVTYDGHRFCEHKDNGLVNDVFGAKTMKQLRGRSLFPQPPLAISDVTGVMSGRFLHHVLHLVRQGEKGC